MERDFLPPGHEVEQPPISFKYESERGATQDNAGLWSVANDNGLPVDAAELAATVEVLQKPRASLVQQSGKTTPRPRTPHMMRTTSDRPDSPTNPTNPTVYTDYRAPPPRPFTFTKQPSIAERKTHLSNQYSEPMDSFPQLPPRGPKRSSWRRPFYPEERVSRRTSGMLFGPGGPATDMDPMISKQPDDRNHKEDSVNQTADPVLVRDYLYMLSKALMLYGAPGHRIERYLTMTAQALKADVQFFYLPDHMTLHIGDQKAQTSHTKLIKGAGTDLGRWLDVHNISKHIVRDGMTIEDAVYKLKEIEYRTSKHSDWFLFLIYGLAGIGIAPFAYGARFVDLPLCFLLSTGLGVLQLKLAPRNHLYSVLFEVSAAIIFSFLGRMFGSIKNVEGDRIFCYSAISQTAINLIQPGYWITNACLELMNRQIATSGSRIMYALVYALLLAYGVAVGSSLYGLIDHDAASGTVCERQISPFWNLFFVPFFSIQVAILGGAKWSQIPAMAAITFSMYCAFFFTLMFANGSFTMAATLGGLTMGLLGNGYARVGRRIEKTVENMFSKNNTTANPESGVFNPALSHTGYTCAAAAMVPAMIVLVPSGLANRGLHLGGIIAADNIIRNRTAVAFPDISGEVMTASLPIFLNVIQIGLSISVGLSIGALAIYPFGKSHSWIMSW
jgi:uncharacterized membrane protein YjjP (DUF1212 family)